ncbi:hypothetical protein [Nocardiopsis sp. YSL2]|uniref:hypothetical protein n=1 Tax=Nocardiopsis sp. YSL2 TaxID=2939492 RepID=UPI0026F45937|nr:hypothetical protein [Nocardiopsis sp. YSL2]
MSVLLATALSCLLLSACSSEDPGDPGGTEELGDSEDRATPDPEESASPEYVSFFWIERGVRVHTLDRMMTEGTPEEVLDNIDDTSRERLLDTRVIQEVDDGYRVELNEDEWDPEAVTFLNVLDSALEAAMSHNEVTWCGEPVTGEEFIEGYTDEFREAFDSHEEYEESIADYVDCGTGEL